MNDDGWVVLPDRTPQKWNKASLEHTVTVTEGHVDLQVRPSLSPHQLLEKKKKKDKI